MHLKERLQNLSQEEIDRCYKDVFTSSKGSIVLDHLAYAMGLDKTSYSQIPGETQFKEGAKQSIYYILDRINVPMLSFYKKGTK